MRSKLLVPIISIIALAGLLVASAMSEEKLPSPMAFDGSVNTSQISNEISNGQATLLDVRTQVEHDLNHAVGSEVFNVEWLKLGQLPDIPKDQRIYVYCRSGNRSADAKVILDQAGYSDVIDLGGINEWTEGGGQLEQSQLDNYLSLLEEIGREPIEALGPADAELTIVKYSDFACPFCAQYTVETEFQLRQDYILDGSDKVRYEFRNYTYLGDESALTAVGGYCANEQSLFWPYHDSITLGYSQSGPDYYVAENLVQTISGLNGDADAFEACLNSGLYDPIVSAETIDVKNSGIESTPTLMIGDQVINGALPYNIFKTTIDAQL